MILRRGGKVAIFAALAMLPLAGCRTPEPEAPVAAPEAESVEPVVSIALASAASVTVSDDPPRELSFSSQLDSRARDLIDREFADELASSRGPATTTAAEFDLNADGTAEIFVIIKSDGWCGSGDVCNMWIYQQTGADWQMISSGRDAASCVSILPTATNGYRDVRLHGQCAINMCTFDLRWDGTVYGWDGNRDCEQFLPSR